MAKREKKKASVRSALSPKEVLALVDDPRARTLLRALGLLTPRGGASADAHRKIKQITHLARLIAPAIEDAYDRHQEPVVVDAAAGKGYIGLLLYERLMRPRGRGRMVLVEAREDLVQRLRRWVRELGYERVEVIHAPVVEAPLPERVHVVVALHACDTATDEVIVRALRARADHVALVPCCQAEVARLLERARRAHGAALVGRLASARVWCALHERPPHARPPSAWLPSPRDRTHRLGAQRKERAHPRAPRGALSPWS